MSKTPSRRSVVAIDLGTNSFHLLEAVADPRGGLQPLTIAVEKVQLGLGMCEGKLHADAIARGLECLKRFASFTVGRSPLQVRVVGTQALRLACNRDDFIKPASQLLGQPVDIVSGEEEAWLAYCGVCSALPDSAEQTAFVIDVGGGSTELAVGCGSCIELVCSAPVGCIASLQHFPQGVINKANLACAQAAAAAQFLAMSSAVRGQQKVIGCSGTLLAIEQVLIQQGWSKVGITRDGLSQLKQALLNFEHIDQVTFQGLSERRRSIFASGVAIALGLFSAFDLQSMSLSPAGLREGIADQLLKRNSLAE